MADHGNGQPFFVDEIIKSIVIYDDMIVVK